MNARESLSACVPSELGEEACDFESLFSTVREALETLGSEAFNQDDLTGGGIATDGITALNEIEAAVLLIARMHTGATQAVLVARSILGAAETTS